MKKIILLIATVFVFVACKGPASLVNFGDKTASAEFSADVKAKEYVMKLKKFKIEDITENLEVGIPYREVDDKEYGMRYVFDNGSDAYIGDGMLIYYNAKSKYPVYYFNSQIDYGSEVDEEGLRICNDYFKKIGLSNMKLVGTHFANVDTIIDKINGGSDILIGKDGSGVNIREKLMDIKIFKFAKSLGGLNITGDGLNLDDDKNLLTSEAYVIINGDSIIFARIEFLSEEVIKSRDTNIITEEGAREILTKEYAKTDANGELKIESTELTLITKPEKLMKHLNKSKIEYSPAYKFVIDDSYEKGGKVYKYSKTIYIDAVKGNVIGL